MTNELPFKISVLIFLRDHHNRFLMIRRAKAPNQGLWSPIGGKLEMAWGESPHECAMRETEEEIALKLELRDLHLFGMISEKGYEGTGHWLMFLFDCRKSLDGLPEPIEEGEFAFFERPAIDGLPIPETDRRALWTAYDRYRNGFIAMRADCHPDQKLDILIEECTLPR